ncbi:MAG: hypothetical protein Ct9H90mV2_080 [Prasinovirus sp.]|jgi:hypothetical protein|nr:MAG: hypothetical protein Ct9H90mV2_080 [Prasinovirus sp.]
MSGTVVFEDAKLQAVELIAETVTLNNFSVSTATTFQQTTNASNVTTNTLKFTNPATAFVTTGNVEVGGELTVGSNVEIGTANLFVDTTTGRVGVGTSSPGTLLELSKSTGSATISPTELRLSTTTNAADWSVTDPWARLSFYTDDVTADAPGVMASVGAVASSADGGENTRLAFFTAEPHVERMCIDRYGNVGIGTTSPSAPLHILGEGGSSDNSATDLSTSVDKAKLRFQSRSGSSLSQYHGTTDSGSTWYQQIANGGGTTSYDMVFNPFGGNVGIGTSSPLQPLNVKANGTNPVIYMTDATNNRYASGMGSNHVSNEGQRLDFYNGDSGANGTSLSSGHIRMSINASGNVGIGTTNPTEKFHVHENLSTTGHQICARMGGTASSSYNTLVFGSKEARPHIGGHRGDYGAWADLSFQNDLMVLKQSNMCVGINKTNPSYPLDVKSDSSMHIEQVGNATYETKIFGGAIFIRNPSTSSGYEHLIINNQTTGGHTTSYIQFRRGNSGNGTAIGTITGNGSTISYGTGSDYRLKENVVPMQISGLDTINNLRPKRFNFIGHSDEIYDGFLAHELQEHIPSAVSGVKDEMRGRGNIVKVDDESIIVKEDVCEPDSLEEGTKWVKLSEEPVYQNVDLSKIVTYLVKAVQEVDTQFQAEKAKVADLLARVEALENA